MNEREGTHTMDEKLQKKIIRQLRGIRFWMSCMCILMLVGFGILGFLTFQLVSTIQKVEKQFSTVQSQASQALDAKNNLCENSLIASTSVCNN